MDFKINQNTLIILPCCANKRRGGAKWNNSLHGGLSSVLSEPVFHNVLHARKEVLELVQKDERYLSKNYQKNQGIISGPDFGENNFDGLYLPAIERYKGSLYSANLDFRRVIAERISGSRPPIIVILSALYGPLHPFDLIQDYNLKMSDSPAIRTWSRHFPVFIEEYVSKFGVKEILLYLGGSTAYMKVAKKAIEPLKNTLDSVLHFDVEKGNAYHTPHNHGLLIAEHLGSTTTATYTRPVIPKSL